MKYGLKDEQILEISNFLKKYPQVERAILFGSRVLGTYKNASDVDIAIYGEKVDWTLAAKLKFDIEEETYLPFFFDFVAYSSIQNQSLKQHIDTYGVILYEKQV